MPKLSKESQVCVSICPQCKLHIGFKPIHPLEVEQDCFLGSYICECNATLMMDYDVTTAMVVARVLGDWRDWRLRSDIKVKCHKVENYYEAYAMDCPICHLTLRLSADIKPDGTSDCDLGKRFCIRCKSVLQINYCKDINKVVATVKENDCE